MLTISKPLNSGQAQTYHAKEFISAEQNYWQKGDAVLGEWQGGLADKYGLAGGISAEHFSRLSEGQNPLSGEQLVRLGKAQAYTTAEGETVKPVEHRAGWDATFSAPKSVSLTALVGGDDRVRLAHREAVTVALTELERYTQARIGRNHPAETTGKFVAAKFEHDTARPVDGYAAPQLHTHAVIFNMTERADGSTRALQERGFFDTQQFATAVYQSELMFRLSQMGYELTTGRSGAPEIKGYTQEYLDASSPRSQQIREHLERSGFTGPEAAQIAAHTTRDRKEIHISSEVLAAHRQIASEFGNQADRVVSEARDRARLQEVGHPANPATLAQQAVTFAKDRNFEREAVTDERNLMRDALRRGMGELTHGQVRQDFDRRHSSGEFQQAPGQKHETGRQFTTREAIAEELSTIKHMQQGRDAAQPIMRREDAESHAKLNDFLNPAQRRVIEEVLTSPDRIHGLQGLAGSGKTTTLSAIREGAERNGYAVEGFAPTSRAAGQLRDAGIQADTLQRFLVRGGTSHTAGDPNSRHLYMVDESSLASTRQMQSFLERIGSQDRVLLIGDTRQHQGVDAGKPFEQMQQAGMRTSHLDQIVRQKDPELLRAVEHLSRNETALGVQLLQQQGRVTEIPERRQRIEAIARDYVARPESTLVVSPDNASRREINDAIRVELHSTGALSKDNRAMTVLTPRSDLTSADRNWASRYQSDDVLYYTRGSKELGIKRGSYATVISTNPKENQVTVKRQDGQHVTYDPKRLHGIAAYREMRREFSKGDRIQFTASKPELNLRNRDLGTVERIEGTKMSVRMDDKKERVLTFDTSAMRHLDHGYVVTSHSSQGLTTARVLVNMDTTAHPELINTRFAYVSVSRASQDARIYTNNAATLAERLNTDITKTSAVEQFRPRSETPTKQSQPEAKEKNMANPNEQTIDEQRRQSQYEPNSLPIRPDQSISDTEQRHYTPIQATLSTEAVGYEWKRETGDIQSYQRNQVGGWLHIDQQGQFYNRQAQPISREHALELAGHSATLAGNDMSPSQTLVKGGRENDLGFSV
jgi:conjugative relaxase-like TrwC/TraI family protein